MRYTVESGSQGKRIDAYLAEVTDLSRSAAAKLIESGAVTIGGKKTEKKYQVKEGDEVELVLPEVEEYEAEPENIPLDVVFEDSDIIVINKPSGMVVHPAPGNYTGTLVNALLYHCKESLSGIGGVMRPGIVHRIDKDTSGLLVVAKNDAAHRALSEELGYHGIEREYHALVRGGFRETEGTVNLPIGRHPVDRKKMAVIKSGEGAREAVTHYEVIRSYGQVSYLKLRLETGRTHQIRVHMSHLGHALLGDEVYGGTKTLFEKQHAPLFDGQILHARRLSLTHPRTGERMTFECELPNNFKKLIEILEKQY
jgi:23S rRNA pseudouridine1911/1915/1917 synthase